MESIAFMRYLQSPKGQHFFFSRPGASAGSEAEAEMELIVKTGRVRKEETWTVSIGFYFHSFNFFTTRMSFWSVTTAAPQWWHTLLPTKPGFLRTNPAPSPSVSNLAIRRASISSAEPIAAFWNTYYCGSDWYMDVSTNWVANYLRDPDVVVLYAHDASLNIKATIVSSPVSQTPVVMSHGGHIRLRCIEGLCVADDMRGAGLAGTMIAAADYYTSVAEPQAHIWCRELPVDPGVFTTAASIKTYAYIPGAAARAAAVPVKIPWHEFKTTWNPYRYTTHLNTIIAEAPRNRNNGIDVWSTEYGGRSYITVVLHTQRRIKKTHQPIYEIIWSSSPNQHIYTSVSSQYKNGIVFTTDADESWKEWNYGRSGVHATYMYNYLPPIFRNCEFIMIREEI
jgi:hypothetical protein